MDSIDCFQVPMSFKHLQLRHCLSVFDPYLKRTNWFASAICNEPTPVFGRQSWHKNLSTSCSRSLYVPIVVEQSGRGERAYDIYSRLLKERIICVFGNISDEVSSVVVAQMLFLQAEDARKPVHMYINSPGESVFFCLIALIDSFPTVYWLCFPYYEIVRQVFFP